MGQTFNALLNDADCFIDFRKNTLLGESSNQFKVTLSGATLDRSLICDGVSKYGYITHNAALEVTGNTPCTFFLTVNIKSFDTDFQRMVSKENGAGSFAIGTRSSKNIHFYFGNAVAETNSSDLKTGVNKIACVHLGSGVYNLYINGSLNRTFTVVTTYPTGLGQNLFFGRRANGTIPFDGDILYYGQWSTKALTETEIQVLTAELEVPPDQEVSSKFEAMEYPQDILAANEILDGDMEASGVTAWLNAGSAFLTKETSTLANSIKCLRITVNVTAAPYAYQNKLTVGIDIVSGDMQYQKEH